MSIKILINALDPEEFRIARVVDSKLEEFYIESSLREITKGNIYKGEITRVEPGLQCVFVEYGAAKQGFLQKGEIHSDYYRESETPKPDHSIQNLVSRGQELLVQVTKDPVMNKGAMLTTYISLAGRYIVLMPGSKNRGISRKIEEEKERKRLKEIIDKLKLPEGFGMIVRTAGQNATKTQLSGDLAYLMRLWKKINKQGVEKPAPSLLYKERNLAVRSLRDSFTPDVTEILVDDPEVHKEVREFVEVISPKHVKTVKQHRSEKPLFTKHQLENQIASIYEKRVALKSGGSIVIDQTEALVAIDVNSGKSTQNRSIEQTAYQTNLEAAEEIARQLKLRDLGGLIVIDFIDMKDNKHKNQVEKALRKYVKTDKAKTHLGRISRFGMLEMSRQRLRPSIDYGNFSPCPHCQGKGLIPTTETLGIRILRKLQLETLKSGITRVKTVLPQDVADYLLNTRRKDILDLEIRKDIRIQILGEPKMQPQDCEITCT